jgi:hypothetical protein
MKTKIFKEYLISILSNNLALTNYSAYLVDEEMTILSEPFGPFYTSVTKDASGLLISVSEPIWEWSGVSGQVRGILILRQSETNAIFVDLEKNVAADGLFTVNWTYVEFFRFKIDSMM